jgi:hypothetical protein
MLKTLRCNMTVRLIVVDCDHLMFDVVLKLNVVVEPQFEYNSRLYATALMCWLVVEDGMFFTHNKLNASWWMLPIHHCFMLLHNSILVLCYHIPLVVVTPFPSIMHVAISQSLFLIYSSI